VKHGGQARHTAIKIGGQVRLAGGQAEPSTPSAENAGCAQDRLRKVGSNLATQEKKW